MFKFFKRGKLDEGVKKTRETWFGRVTKLFDRSTIDDSLWDELEELLIGADVGAALATQLIQRIKERAKTEHLNDPPSVRDALKDELAKVLSTNGRKSALLSLAAETALPSKPYVILVVGVNGVGKTTSIAKLAQLLKEGGKSVVLAAGDTYRAAGVEQLEIWAKRAGAEIVMHKGGADPAAVVFDALQAAKARGADTVIVDTAGRLHTKFNLMEELKKVGRIIGRFDTSAPHEVLLVVDATTGQNGLSQAKHFAEAVGVTGIVLSKLDGTAKGGIVLSICDQLKIPILFVGTGEKIDDLAPFDAQEFVEALFSSEG